ncbi:Rieske 2Fe-2S domain-containing protein [Desertimonas flava]|uniref:Rieske 2Fe-2S domain-containing protein n=1 Tax=Desertimonas flava TaxID=2064846 RepID=UPI0013C4A955|nr:Rieske 2Fe-2S domain-containing protein [Desertimonas flava]
MPNSSEPASCGAAGRTDEWTVVARSDDVDPGPIARSVGGRPIVVWRTAAGRLSALADSCPHQGNPLSDGTVAGHELLCRYHGWSVASDGWCERAAGGTRAYAVREVGGDVCVRDPMGDR